MGVNIKNWKPTLLIIAIAIIVTITLWIIWYMTINQVILEVTSNAIKDMAQFNKWIQFDIFSHCFR